MSKPGEKGFVDTGNVSAKAIRELGKIKPKQWKSMGNTFKELNTLMSEGGLSVSRLFGGPVDIIKAEIENTVTGLFAPIINEITSLVGYIVDEAGLSDAIEDVTDSIGNFIDSLKTLLEDIERPEGRTNPIEEGKNMLEKIFDFWNYIVLLVTGGIKVVDPHIPQLPDPSTPWGPGHYLPDDTF